MAQNHRDLQADLVWLDRLPGTKILAPGNHDQWSNGVEKIRPMLRASLEAVDGNAVTRQGVVVCGTATAPVTLDRKSDDESQGSTGPWDRSDAHLKTPADCVLVLTRRCMCCGPILRSMPMAFPVRASRCSSDWGNGVLVRAPSRPRMVGRRARAAAGGCAASVWPRMPLGSARYGLTGFGTAEHIQIVRFTQVRPSRVTAVNTPRWLDPNQTGSGAGEAKAPRTNIDLLVAAAISWYNEPP